MVSPAATEVACPAVVSEQVAGTLVDPDADAVHVNDVLDPFLKRVIDTPCAEAETVGVTDA